MHLPIIPINQKKEDAMVIAVLLFAFLMSLIKEVVDKLIHNKESDRQADKMVESALKEPDQYKQ